ELKKLVVEKPVKEVKIKGIASVLKKIAAKCKQIIIATDYDREGELIGKEVLEILGISPNSEKVKRAKFSALTKHEITQAFNELQKFDEALADSAAARQEIDLKWGAVLTRFISTSSGRTGKDFLSVGRVQSPTLALVVENDELIKNFVPQKFWEILAELEKSTKHTKKSEKKQVVLARHCSGRIFEETKVKEILEKLKDVDKGFVKNYNVSEHREFPPPPFNTTAFLAEASKLGYSPAKSMQIAENLYMRGFISYPRTDNTVYPPSINLRNVLQELRNTAFREMAEEILSQEKITPSRGKVETTDHPPIYPAGAAEREKLSKDEWEIYELIVRRFLATLAPPSIVETKKVVFDINGEEFIAEGSIVLDPGWRKYYIYSKRTESPLPLFQNGEVVSVISINAKEDKTKPPGRYSQSALLQAMEKLGLGTKSTRHEIIQKLYERKYITGNPIIPTASGKAVINALKAYAEIVTKPEMTSKLEDEMSDIANRKTKMENVIKDSEQILLKIVEILEKNRKCIGDKIRTAIKEQHYIGKCGKCGGDLSIIHTNTHRRFVGCSNFPSCDVSFTVPQRGHIEKTDEICSSCRMPVVKITHKGQGSEKICINPDCKAHTEKRKIGICPKCGSEMQVMHGHSGKRFIGCTNYPKCKTAYPLPQKGKIVYTGKKCEVCGAPVVKVVVNKNAWENCVNPECPKKHARS
ncbi:MAG: DNA topoisomerase I, partial [Thermoplasmata archaeon]